jgi:hypothetical protein
MNLSQQKHKNTEAGTFKGKLGYIFFLMFRGKYFRGKSKL